MPIIKRSILISCLLIVFFPVSGQNDLKKLYAKGIALLDSSDTNKALLYFKQGLQVAKNKNDLPNEALFLNELGFTYETMGNLDTALALYEKAREISETGNIDDIKATAYKNLANIYAHKGAYEKASTLLSDAAILFDSLNYKEDLSACLNSIGNIQFKIGDHKQALYFYKRALTTFNQLLNDPSQKAHTSNYNLDIAIVLNNIGEAYMQKSIYDSALIYLQKSLKIKQTLQAPAFEANTLNKLGETYHATRNYAQAKLFYTKAYNIRTRNADSPAVANSAISLAALYYDVHNYNMAYRYARTGERIAARDSLLNDLLRVYNIKRLVHKKLNQYKEALFYDSLFIALNHMLTNTEQMKLIHKLHTQYATELKDKDIEASEKKNLFLSELDVIQKRLIFAITIASVLIIITIVIAYLQKRKDKQQLELALRELNHRVKNNFQQLSGVLSLYKAQLSDRSAQNAIAETANRVHAMGLVHRKLYLDANQLTTVRLDLFIREITHELILSYGFNENNLKLKTELHRILINADRAVPIALIANELLTNAFKYGFKNNANPELEVKLKLTDKKICLLIKDNGAGIRNLPDKQTSFGMKLVNLQVKQLNGTIEQELTEGVSTKIIIPQVL